MGAFDGVALLVALAVEPGGSAASGASVLAVSLLVEAFRDGVPDTVSSQVTSVLPGRVGLVRQDVIGPGARPADSGAGHGDLLKHARELGAVAVVSGCQDEGERSASSVGDEVDFGGESAAGASQTLADLTTSSSRTASFRNTGSTWFVPRTFPFEGLWPLALSSRRRRAGGPVPRSSPPRRPSRSGPQRPRRPGFETAASSTFHQLTSGDVVCRRSPAARTVPVGTATAHPYAPCRAPR